MEQGKVFRGGVPTAPDVRKLREMFPDKDLNVGDVLAYDDIAEVVGCAYGTSRFKSITDRWRKLVENESGKIIGVSKGVGFAVLSDSQKLEVSHQKLRTAVRSAGRSLTVAMHIDRSNLTDDERLRLDHQNRINASLLAAAQISPNTELPKLL